MLSLKAILGLDATGFELGVKRAQSAAQKFSKNIGGELTGRFAQLFTIAAAEQAIQKTIQYAGHIADLSDRLGISTDALQQWDYALKQAGADANTAATFFENLAAFRERALSGDIGAQSTLSKFGIGENELRNSRLQDLGLQIGRAFQNGDQQKLLAPLKEIGGKAGAKIAAAMRAGLEDTMANAPIIKAEDIIELDKLGDKIGGLGQQLMAAFAPVLLFIGNTFLGFIDSWKLAFNQVAVAAHTLLGGGSFKEAMEAYREVTKEFEKEKSKPKSPKSPKAAGGGDTPRKQRPFVKTKSEDFFSKFAPKEPGQLNINSLQEMGALVRTSSVQSDIKTIAEEARRIGYTTRELLNEAKRPKTPPPGFGPGERTLY